MNNSKEALERIETMFPFNKEYKSNYYSQFSSSVEPFYKDFNLIKQDLDRLEKLEKKNASLQSEIDGLQNKNKKLLVNKNIAQGIATKLKQENDKLKKAIEILNDKFKFELGVSTVKEKYYYSLEFLYNYQYFRITQEEYELLKEVLGND